MTHNSQPSLRTPKSLGITLSRFGEARSDLERSRATLISLIEQVRSEGVHTAGSSPGASGAVVNERLDEIGGRLVELDSCVERCLARQNELADTMAAFLDTILAERSLG